MRWSCYLKWNHSMEHTTPNVLSEKYLEDGLVRWIEQCNHLELKTCCEWKKHTYMIHRAWELWQDTEQSVRAGRGDMGAFWKCSLYFEEWIGEPRADKSRERNCRQTRGGGMFLRKAKRQERWEFGLAEWEITRLGAWDGCFGRACFC